MLMEISNLITPEVYEIIYRMGHMDELLTYFPLDSDEEFPVTVMTPDHGYSHDPEIWADYASVLSKSYATSPVVLNKISRQEFYRRTRKSYATIQTSDPRLYADILIRKGVVC